MTLERNSKRFVAEVVAKYVSRTSGGSHPLADPTQTSEEDAGGAISTQR